MKILQPNDNVFIQVPESHTFHGAYGIVKKVKGDKVVVHFEKQFSHLLIGEYIRGKTTEEFDIKEVIKFNLEDELEIWATITYGSNMFHHLGSLPYKFSPENDCMYHACKEKATKRILYNAWGNVYEHDVCKTHEEMHGYCGDGFYLKKYYQATVKIPKEKKVKA